MDSSVVIHNPSAQCLDPWCESFKDAGLLRQIEPRKRERNKRILSVIQYIKHKTAGSGSMFCRYSKTQAQKDRSENG